MTRNKENLETVVKQEWIESEKGWGIRPDGYSLHKNVKDRDLYVKKYWDSMPDEVPDEYSRPIGLPVPIDVNKKTYDRICKSEYGIRLYKEEFEEVER
ncbi:MAG: hypothetical protein KKA51_06280 [Nanoarchaeota archaeon]|nr:hypothetical protein [Nanoarchaeota archaeon]